MYGGLQQGFVIDSEITFGLVAAVKVMYKQFVLQQRQNT